MYFERQNQSILFAVFYVFAVLSSMLLAGPDLDVIPEIEWIRNVGGSEGEDQIKAMAVDGENNVIVVGEKGFVAKIHRSGKILWSSYVGGKVRDSVGGVAVDSRGDIFVVGRTMSSEWLKDNNPTEGQGDDQFEGRAGFLVKISGTGERRWSVLLGGPHADNATDVAVDSDGNIIIVGYTSLASGDIDLGAIRNGGFIIKLDRDGSLLWRRHIGGVRDSVAAVAVDRFDNVLISGWTRTPNWAKRGHNTKYSGNGDGFVAKLSESGDHIWSSYVGGDSGDVCTGIAVDDAGGIVVIGITDSLDWAEDGVDVSHEGTIGFVVKLESDGAHVWSRYVGSGITAPRAVAASANNKLYISGSTNAADWFSGEERIQEKEQVVRGFVLKLDDSGDILWSSVDIGTAIERINDVVVTQSGSIFFGGRVRGLMERESDIGELYSADSLYAFLAKMRRK